MMPARSLWLKLSLGFVLVAVVAVGLTAILANRATTRQFQIYVSQGRQTRAERLAPAFATYYALTGSWTGVAEWMANLESSQLGGRGQGQGRGLSLSATDRLLLADADGRVVADSQNSLEGQQLSSAELAFGAPIAVGDQLVGTLLIPSTAGVHETLEAGFLQQVNQSLIWAGLAAGAVALVLGLVITRQLTAPLRELTHAAQRLTREKPGQTPQQDVPQVSIRSQDEIGQLSQAFNQMAQSLARQETLRRNLMADIAHELRTPLTIMRSDLEALLDGVYEPTPEIVASLQEETLLLSRLVDDLRALAQAEAGQLRLERQPTDLVDLLVGVVASFDLKAESEGQALTQELPPSLPLVDVDPQRVRQIAANLVSNALRHASGRPEGSGTSRVVVSAARQGDMVQVSVVDNGPGIAPEDLPHIFDRFWQGDRAGAGSSGLGLTIARELVRAHGGKIWAESVPGQGATLRFTLPVYPNHGQR
jgi:signal transduction histidine kinase